MPDHAAMPRPREHGMMAHLSGTDGMVPLAMARCKNRAGGRRQKANLNAKRGRGEFEALSYNDAIDYLGLSTLQSTEWDVD